MSNSGARGADLDPRRRRLLFRCWHRGIREMDLIMGRFAEAKLADLTAVELDDLEKLIEVPDPDLFAWLTDAAPTPANYASSVFRRLKDFHRHAGPLYA